MKLRIRGNSIRLRIDRGEVDRLAEGRIEDSISFGGEARLAYTLEVRPQQAPLAATFDGGQIRVFLSSVEAERLRGTEDVSVENEQPIDGGVLRLLVEKDFACLTPRFGEDDSHAYINPKGQC